MQQHRLIASLVGTTLALGLSACIQPTEHELEEWVKYPHSIVDPEEPEAKADQGLDVVVDADVAEPAQVTGPGELDASEIDEAFDARSDVILDCYRQELVSNQTAEGAIQLRFVVPPSGYARQVRVVENSVGQQAGRCVADAVSGWSLPAPNAQPVTVQKEIELSIEEQ